MNDKTEKTVRVIEVLGLNNLETYVLTHNGFNIYMVSIFSDLNKTQIYKLHIEIVKILRLIYL